MKKTLIFLYVMIFLLGCDRGWLRKIADPNYNGCTDKSACNYNKLSYVDDGSCIPKKGCNQWCEGVGGSPLEIDCVGECGGSAEVDECGVCGGGGVQQECACGSPGEYGIPVGDCDCNGNVEDCAGECGGSAEVDECCVCGGNGIPLGACDCEGNTQDDDNDGICDHNDADSYGTIQIGEQVWMSENLKVTQYSNGDIIPEIDSNSECSNQSNGAYIVYDNTPSNTNIYGNLYNWYAVNDDRGICLDGWHVPSDDEWTILVDYLGGTGVAGGKMKETGTTHWNSPNAGATNASGFTGLPSGKYQGSHDSVGEYGYFWSNSAIGDNVSNWQLAYNNSNAYNGTVNIKAIAMSVRCIKNNNN